MGEDNEFLRMRFRNFKGDVLLSEDPGLLRVRILGS